MKKIKHAKPTVTANEYRSPGACIMRYLRRTLRKWPCAHRDGREAPYSSLIQKVHKMSSWEERLKEAEAGAERSEAAEQEAEKRFKALQGNAQAQGRADEALQSEEFHSWMASRHATDDAWGKWSIVMDAKPGA